MRELLEDNLDMREVYDLYDFWELVEIMFELGILTKDAMFEDYWDEIEEHIEDFRQFPKEESGGSDSLD